MMLLHKDAELLMISIQEINHNRLLLKHLRSLTHIGTRTTITIMGNQERTNHRIWETPSRRTEFLPELIIDSTHIQIAGRLKLFKHQWHKTFGASWATNIVSQGYSSE